MKMMPWIYPVGLMVFALSLGIIAGHDAKGAIKKNEAYYVQKFCQGTVEYRNTDRTRTDCLTEATAQEFDWDYKWYECLTQAMHYAKLNGRKAECVLIKDRDGTERYVDRAKDLIKYYDLPVTVKVVYKDTV